MTPTNQTKKTGLFLHLGLAPFILILIWYFICKVNPLLGMYHLHVAPNFRSTFLWEILISEVELIGGMKHLFI